MTRARTHRIAALLTALAAILGLAVALPSEAGAGTYRVLECDKGAGTGRGDLRFGGGGGYSRDGGCAGRGLLARHESRRSRRGARGGWRIDVPAGIRVTRVAARLRGRRDSGHRPHAELRADGRTRSWSLGHSRRVAWSGDRATSLWAGLSCERRGGCAEGRRAVMAIRSLAMTVSDAVAPELEVSGELLADGSRRGTDLASAAASDAGSGVHRVSVEVNGRVVGARIADCAKRGQTAFRLRPCPTSTDPVFTLDTAAKAFRQGPNLVRICAADWAERSRANDSCRTRPIRVDNACPVSERGGDAEMGARIVRRDGRRRVAGRLTTPSGQGLEGRTVCVATRVKLGGRAERVVATPLTGADGRFTADLGRGPNREVRVAYWSSPERVAERRMHLTEPARPSLRVRPRRIRNGGRARFRVQVPGPNRAGVRVRIEARSGGRWLELRAGRTSTRGRFGARYRFRSTTASRRYAFRALVPAQPGYPYGRGSSPVKRIKVRP